MHNSSRQLESHFWYAFTGHSICSESVYMYPIDIISEVLVIQDDNIIWGKAIEML